MLQENQLSSHTQLLSTGLQQIGVFFFFFHHACESRLNSSTTISASFFFPIPFNIWTRRSIIDVYILLLLLFGTMVVHLEVICVFRCSPTLIKGLGRPTVKRVLIASVPYYLQLEILDLCKSTQKISDLAGNSFEFSKHIIITY